MRQLSFAGVGFDRFGKTTRRGAFLAEMGAVVLWKRLYGLIEPFYAKPGKGRRPVGLDRMLRIYFLQHWFGLSDPAAEESLYGSEAIRRCAPRAKDFTNQRCKFKGVVDEAEKAKNARKSKVRAKVEHCFAVMKRVSGFTKVRYRGINKNAGWLFTTCALVNLFMAGPQKGQGVT